MRTLGLLILIISVTGCAEVQNPHHDRILIGHQATVLSLDNDKEGKYLCSGSYDTDMILWDYDSGRLLKRFEGLKAGIWNVRISPDGKYLACGSWNNNTNAQGSTADCLGLLDIKSFDLINTFSIGPDRYNGLGFIPELDDSTTNGILRISFNPGSTKLAVITHRGDLFTWDLADNFKKSEYLFGDTKHKIIDISPDWKYLICTERKRRMVDSCFYFMNIDENKIVARFDTPAKTVIRVFFSNDLRTVASTGGNRITRNEIYLWDIETQKLKHTLLGHKNVIRSIDFSSDDKFLASVGEDNLINIWNVMDGELIATLTEANNKELTSVLFSFDDQYLITGSQDMTIKYWDIRNLIKNR